MSGAEVMWVDNGSEDVIGFVGEGDRARRFIMGESCGEVFGEDDHFQGLTLTVEVCDSEEGLRLLAALSAALAQGVPS